MKTRLLPVLLLAVSATASAQKYQIRTLSQFKWDDSAQKQVICVEHYNDKGKVIFKDYMNSQSVVDASEDGDDKGTKVYYAYKDSLLMSEYRYRTPEYEDSVLTNNSYNAKGQMMQQVIRRHVKFTSTGDGGALSTSWRWLSDTIIYEYNIKGQMIAQKGGERWHRISYNGQQLVSKDTSFFSTEELKAKTFFAASNTYNADKQVLKKVKDHYVKGQKHFNNTIEYSYADGKLVKLHSTATSYSKNKLESAKLENMRFDKKFFYDQHGRVQKVETWDPDGFRLQTDLYTYR